MSDIDDHVDQVDPVVLAKMDDEAIEQGWCDPTSRFRTPCETLDAIDRNYPGGVGAYIRDWG